jgi:hypothetical protein
LSISGLVLAGSGEKARAVELERRSQMNANAVRDFEKYFDMRIIVVPRYYISIF